MAETYFYEPKNLYPEDYIGVVMGWSAETDICTAPGYQGQRSQPIVTKQAPVTPEVAEAGILVLEP